MEATGTGSASPDAPAERVRVLVEQVVAALDLDASVEVDDDGAEIVARVEPRPGGEDLGLLIGRRGQTIDALQLLCYRAAFKEPGERRRVTVDAAGYRERRAELLHRDADRAAERAAQSGREVRLDPMSATERKVVHDHLKDRAGVETYSEGEEPERYVVVAPPVTR